MENTELSRVNVLDKGYVILHNTMGDDLTVANAARVSYDKKKATMDERDARLIAFLAREGHTSPFRHATLQFELYAPLMVARQHWKQVVGSDHTMDAWNESSRRYITEEPAFYLVQADQWRGKPENSKQGSGEPVQLEIGTEATRRLIATHDNGIRDYEWAMENGICAEQARLYLPAYGLYVRWYWTASLQSVSHFLNQRIAHDAQKEIQDYAKAVYVLAKEKFPVSLDQLLVVDPNG